MLRQDGNSHIGTEAHCLHNILRGVVNHILHTSEYHTLHNNWACKQLILISESYSGVVRPRSLRLHPRMFYE